MDIYTGYLDEKLAKLGRDIHALNDAKRRDNIYDAHQALRAIDETVDAIRTETDKTRTRLDRFYGIKL